MSDMKGPYTRLWSSPSGSQLILYDGGAWIMTVRSWISPEMREEALRRLLRFIEKEMSPEKYRAYN